MLSAASDALAPQRSCPVALATTWAVLRLLRRQRAARSSNLDRSGGRDRDLELELELALDARLRARGGMRRGACADDAADRTDEGAPPRDGTDGTDVTANFARSGSRLQRPAWRPSTIGEEALAIAGDIEAELAALLAS